MVEESEDSDLKYQLKIIKDTSADTLELINEILEATSNASPGLHKQLVEINSLLNNSVELLRFKAAEKTSAYYSRWTEYNRAIIYQPRNDLACDQ